jgi:hypothetical protein
MIFGLFGLSDEHRTTRKENSSKSYATYNTNIPCINNSDGTDVEIRMYHPVNSPLIPDFTIDVSTLVATEEIAIRL